MSVSSEESEASGEATCVPPRDRWCVFGKLDVDIGRPTVCRMVAVTVTQMLRVPKDGVNQQCALQKAINDATEHYVCECGRSHVENVMGGTHNNCSFGTQGVEGQGVNVCVLRRENTVCFPDTVTTTWRLLVRLPRRIGRIEMCGVAPIGPMPPKGRGRMIAWTCNMLHVRRGSHCP